SNYDFVSASNGGSFSGGKITWNLVSVPGFRSATGIPPTRGSFTFTVKIKDALASYQRVCLVSTITASNSNPWTSNEFPNNASYRMERNCVDLMPSRSLSILKTADRTSFNPNDIINFKLEFENKIGSQYILNTGRDRVNLSYGNYLMGNTFYQHIRFWHHAPEAYINFSNYRVSYFMNDPSAVGLYNAATNPTGWTLAVDNQLDLDKYMYNPASGPITFSYQEIPFGSDANGSWNQRMIIRFANQLTSPTSHIYDKLDSPYLIHKGVIGPALIRLKLEANPSVPMAAKLADDWSYSVGVQSNALDGQSDRLKPITNSWENPASLNTPINNYGKDICNATVTSFDRLLVEEYDGYVWRRILGRSPLPGLEAENVVVYDTIPKQLSWRGFTDSLALGIRASYTAAPTGANYTGIVTWTTTSLLVGSKGDLGYKTMAKDPPCPSPDINFPNVGWIRSKTDSPDSSRVNLRLTCGLVPPVVVTSPSMSKRSDKSSYNTNDPITYTISYVNTLGSNTFDSFTTTSTWTAPSGSPGMPTSFADLTAPYTSPKYFYQNKSHGTNGVLKFKLKIENSWNHYSLMMRYKGGTPGTAGYNGVALDIWTGKMGFGTLIMSAFNNNTKVGGVDPNNPIAYPTLPSSTNDVLEITVKLTDSQMDVWVNKDYLSTPPLQTYTCLTNTLPGYNGLFNGQIDGTLNGGSNGKPILYNWQSNFDSAFDLLMYDPVPISPSIITAPSVISGIRISTGAGVVISTTGIGNFTGNSVSGYTIRWPSIAGPVLANTTLSSSWSAAVFSCVGFISNTAYITTTGISSGIAAQVNNSCVGSLSLDDINLSVSKFVDGNLIQWQVLSSKSYYYADLEASSDGKNFQMIHRWSEYPRGGSYLEKLKTKQTRFYRIAAYGKYGDVDYSPVKKINSWEEHQILVYPNPYSGGTQLFVQSMLKEESVNYKIIDITGKTVADGNNLPLNETIDLGAGITAGTYILQVYVGEEVVTKKLVKLD
ncbi:MAG: T9SS type A sorting domain-containing protein, partial [Cytophagales bacterium]|nr:T9SS type A sorting domain-containing protein [Cytophagales bacterium]